MFRHFRTNRSKNNRRNNNRRRTVFSGDSLQIEHVLSKDLVEKIGWKAHSNAIMFVRIFS